MTSDDAQLLRRYVEQRDEAAFTGLVNRYINLVWGAGYRVTRDADLSRDVAQIVFAELARTAGRFAFDKPLAGWLYRTAYHTAAKMVRKEVRRVRREQETMQTRDTPPESGEPEIEALLPMLDEAVAQLGSLDREAIVLRYLHRKSLSEVGTALGASDDAAQKRLSRALEKLRGQFRRRGMAVSGTALATALGAAGSQACPAGVAATVAASSLAAVGTAGAAVGVGSFLSAVPTQLALMKTKLAIGTLTIAGVAGPLWIQQGNLSELRAENTGLSQQTALLEQLRDENTRLQSRRLMADELDRLRRNHDELLALRDEAARLRANEAEEKARLQQRLFAAQNELEEARAAAERVEMEIAFKANHARTVNEMKQLGLAARLYATENDAQLPATFEKMSAFLAGGFELDPYEFMPHERPILETDPQMIVFREKEPRRTPDGEWNRAYTLADGSVQSIRRSSLDEFEEFERGRIARIEDPVNQP